MLQYLKNMANRTRTENGALTHKSTESSCLDLFATIGARRCADDREIISRFALALYEDPDLALKTLFYARDIRGGLGERKVFRVCLGWLAKEAPESVRKNIPHIAEYGRWDDLLCLLDTPCEVDALLQIRFQLEEDLRRLEAGNSVSLLAKWLPSANASNAETVRMARKIARYLGMSEARYRKTLVALRQRIRILENNLREMDYSFDYEQQPSKAMLKYRKAFRRNDGFRYQVFLNQVSSGQAKLNTGTLAPYEIIAPLMSRYADSSDRAALDVTWNAQQNFAGDENALVVMDGSGSMYYCNNALPAAVAQSLAIYFAERNTGAFRNHFITFSENPRLVEIKGRDIYEKVRYCQCFNEIANTNLAKVFQLLLDTAVANEIPQEEMPSTLYIISDMEFDACAKGADLTNFQHAQNLFSAAGYRLPRVVFWNVASRNRQQPVTQNEQGVALVSGCSPRIFDMLRRDCYTPTEYMLSILNGERYARICA